MGHQFIAWLEDKKKFDLVQVYLGVNKSTVGYASARQAVKKAYRQFEEPTPFDGLNNQPMLPPPSLSLQSKLVALLQSLQIPQAPPPRDNFFYRSNYASANRQGELQVGPRQYFVRK